MGIYSIKPAFQKTLTPIKNYLVRNKVSPTTINLCGLFFSVFAGYSIFYSQNSLALLLLVPIYTTARTAMNALDGLVARELKARNQEFGEVLNETIDRISDSIIFLCLSFTPNVNTTLGFFTLVVILLNSYLSIVSKAAGGTRQYGGFMGKADRMIYISVASVLTYLSKNFGVMNLFLLFTLFGTLVTFGQRFINIKKELVK